MNDTKSEADSGVSSEQLNCFGLGIALTTYVY